MTWEEIIGFAGKSETGIQNLGGVARNYWDSEDLRVLYPDSWRHGTICQGLARMAESWWYGKIAKGLPTF